LALGSMKLGFSHKLNSKNVFGASLSKNLAKDGPVGIELGLQSQCFKDMVSRVKVI